VYDHHRHGNRSARIQIRKDYVPVEPVGEQSARQNKDRNSSEDNRRRMVHFFEVIMKLIFFRVNLQSSQQKNLQTKNKFNLMNLKKYKINCQTFQAGDLRKITRKIRAFLNTEEKVRSPGTIS